MREDSSSIISWDFPFVIITCWICFIFSWSWFLALKISRNYVLFHSLNCCFNFFKCWCNMNLGDPKLTVVSFHQEGKFEWKEGWCSKKDSNRKGPFFIMAWMLMWRQMGQWSDPWRGRMEVVMEFFLWRMGSEKRKQSKQEEILWSPLQWLFQVKMLLVVSQSTNPSSLMVSLKQDESCSRKFRPPCFSERDEMILKPPPRSQGW